MAECGPWTSNPDTNVILADLDTGTYTVHVRSVDADGNVSDEVSDTINISGGSSDYDGLVLAKNPLTYYKSNERSGTTLNDSTGNGNDAAGDAIVGDSFQIEATGTQEWSAGGFSISNSQNLTVEGWFQFHDGSGNQALVTIRDNGGAALLLGLDYGYGAGVPCIFINNAFRWNGSTALNDNVRHHIVAQYEPGQSLDIYIDGVHEAHVADSWGGHSADTIWVASNTANVQNYIGLFDRVAIYDSLLSGHQVDTSSSSVVSAHYNSGTALLPPFATAVMDLNPTLYLRGNKDTNGSDEIDMTNNGHDGSFNSIVSWDPARPFIGEASWNFGGGWISIPYDTAVDPFLSKPISMAFWVKSADNQGIVASQDSGSGAHRPWLVGFIGDYKMDAIMNNQLGGTHKTTMDVSDDTWHFVVITMNDTSNTINTYIDGTLESTFVETQDLQDPNSTGIKIGIGAAGDRPLGGYVSNFAMWYGTELSSADVISMYSSMFEEIVVSLPYTAAGNADDLFNWIGTESNTDSFIDATQRGLVWYATSWHPGYKPWYGFDHNNSTTFLVNNEADGYIWLDIGPRRTFSLDHYAIRNRHDNGNTWPRGWVLEGSTDDAIWHSIDTHTNEDNWSAPSTWADFTVSATSPYRYFRITFPELNPEPNYYNGFSAIEFYGTLYQTNPQIQAGEINLSPVTGQGLVEYLATVDGSDSWDNPVHRGRIETYTEYWYNDGYTWAHYNLLDGNRTTDAWIPTSSGSAGTFPLTYDLGPDRTMRPSAIMLAPRYGYHNGTVTWSIMGSNDNSIWDTLDTWTEIFNMYNSAGNTPMWFQMSQQATSYRYLQIILNKGTSQGDGDYPSIGDWEIYGFLTENSPLPATGTRYSLNGTTDALQDFQDILHNVSLVSDASTDSINIPSKLYDATNAEFFTGNAVNSSIEFDFGWNTVRLEGFAFMPRGSYDTAPGDMLIEGWNGFSWDSLRSITNPKPQMKYIINDWGFWWVEAIDYYSKIRVTQTSASYNGNDYFGGLEAQMFGDYVINTPDDYNTAALALSPTFHLPMQEPSGSTAFDATANGHDGALEGAGTHTTLGSSGPGSSTSALFDSTGGIVIPYASGLDTNGMTQLTTAAWVNPTSGYGTVVSSYSNDAPSTARPYIMFAGSSSLSVAAEVNDATYPTYGGGLASGWHHVAAVWDLSINSIKLYIDGILVRATNASSQATFQDEVGHDVTIGRDDINNGILNAHYIGSIAYLSAWYGVALGPNDIFRLANATV